MQEEGMRIALVSLGCPKNLVDSEYMADLIRADGGELVSDPAEAAAIVVNTCGFIDSAKAEAIDTILEMARYKEAGSCRHLIVTGCLAQRYPEEIQRDLPEVDAVLGVSAYGEIARILRALEQAHRERTGAGAAASEAPRSVLCHAGAGDTTAHFRTKRRVSTGAYAYLKIAEGCSNRCAYCAIPGIRGNMVSRPMEDVVREAEDLLAQGCRELVLVAQDTTAYGADLYQRRALPDLLDRLCALPGDFGIRLLYCYSDGMTDALRDTIARQPKILPYIDMPIQHGSDTVLRRMGRKDSSDGIRAVVESWRRAIPDLVFRTTVMVGFPGETEAEFEALLDLVGSLAFERLGCFVFCPEEGTRAAQFPDPVPAAVSADREKRLMQLQRKVSDTFHERRIGTVCRVLLESVSEDGLFYLGRSAGESPDIDPVLYVLDAEQGVAVGEYVWAKIVSREGYDLTAVTCAAPTEGVWYESP